MAAMGHNVVILATAESYTTGHIATTGLCSLTQCPGLH